MPEITKRQASLLLRLMDLVPDQRKLADFLGCAQSELNSMRTSLVAVDTLVERAQEAAAALDALDEGVSGKLSLNRLGFEVVVVSHRAVSGPGGVPAPQVVACSRKRCSFTQVQAARVNPLLALINVAEMEVKNARRPS